MYICVLLCHNLWTKLLKCTQYITNYYLQSLKVGRSLKIMVVNCNQYNPCRHRVRNNSQPYCIGHFQPILPFWPSKVSLLGQIYCTFPMEKPLVVCNNVPDLQTKGHAVLYDHMHVCMCMYIYVHNYIDVQN